MPLVIEGLLTTIGPRGVNVAPMGPTFEFPSGGGLPSLTLRPFPGSTTCDNLLATRTAVFHITDDAELMARAAIGSLDPLPTLAPCAAVEGWIIPDACRWYALRIVEIDETPPRYRLACEVVAAQEQRSFLGFNRARHAIVEAAILATRRHLLPRDEIAAEMRRWRPLIEKTGADAERLAWRLLADFLELPELA